MPEEMPIDKTMNEIKKILKLIQDNFNTLVDLSATAQTAKELEEFEKKIEAFAKESEQTLLSAGLKKEDIQKLEDNSIPENAPPEIQATLQEAMRLKQKILELQGLAYEEQGRVQEAPKKPKKSQVKKENKAAKRVEHKKKYKGLGGFSDWKPL